MKNLLLIIKVAGVTLAVLSLISCSHVEQLQGNTDVLKEVNSNRESEITNGIELSSYEGFPDKLNNSDTTLREEVNNGLIDLDANNNFEESQSSRETEITDGGALISYEEYLMNLNIAETILREEANNELTGLDDGC